MLNDKIPVVRTHSRATHDWVRENLADRIKLREEHTGNIAWDDAP